MKTVIKMVSSGLYLGYSPIASGTVGSLLGILIYLQTYEFPFVYILVCALLLLLGFLVCGKAEEIYGQKDSRRIVIDEIAGMCIVYLGFKPQAWVIIVGFILYRVLDIIKPPPAGRFQDLDGSAGVMLDDIVCAVYTNLILQVLVRVPCAIGS